MISYLPEQIQTELDQLAQRYGQPLLHRANLDTNDSFDPLDKKDRYGEVCMVIRRKNGRLLTMKKTFYPPEAYRLLTGGIHLDEGVFAALQRETAEETGLEVAVRRFLAVIQYHLAHTGEQPVFYTFAFLLDELSGTLQTIDEEEQVEDFREIEVSTLPDLAAYLNGLKMGYSPELQGKWGDWGAFRAVIHQVVWNALQAQS